MAIQVYGKWPCKVKTWYKDQVQVLLIYLLDNSNDLLIGLSASKPLPLLVKTWWLPKLPKHLSFILRTFTTLFPIGLFNLMFSSTLPSHPPYIPAR